MKFMIDYLELNGKRRGEKRRGCFGIDLVSCSFSLFLRVLTIGLTICHGADGAERLGQARQSA